MDSGGIVIPLLQDVCYLVSFGFAVDICFAFGLLRTPACGGGEFNRELEV